MNQSFEIKSITVAGVDGPSCFTVHYNPSPQKLDMNSCESIRVTFRTKIDAAATSSHDVKKKLTDLDATLVIRIERVRLGFDINENYATNVIDIADDSIVADTGTISYTLNQLQLLCH